MVALPRLVIAAPASGCGKTTVATGLMAALRGRGLAVSGHKVGPDYIDPGYHALATGRPGRNLDAFLCGEELIGPLLARGAQGADVAVIEGAMGLFDGVVSPAGSGPADFGSTAHVARQLGAPVVLVVDAASAGRSVAALVMGFAGFDPQTRVAGVILNRVGSDRHELLLREAVASIGIPVYGAIRRTDTVTTPSRHLGLVPVAERVAVARATVARLAALVADSCDLEGILSLARQAPLVPAEPWDPLAALIHDPLRPDAKTCPDSAGSRKPSFPSSESSNFLIYPDGGVVGRPVIAVAEGAAFTFGYAEHAELLGAAGAEVVPFDPLRDEALPDRTAGLLIGGGFPEVYAAELSANEPLRCEVAALAATGAPVAAECAGLLFLSRTLEGLPMCAVLDADGSMTDRLTLGYRRAQAARDSVLAPAGQHVRGHEFHRTAVAPASGRCAAWRLSSGTSEGHVNGNVVASYLHIHWAGHPGFAAKFAAAARTAAARTATIAGTASSGTASSGTASSGTAS